MKNLDFGRENSKFYSKITLGVKIHEMSISNNLKTIFGVKIQSLIGRFLTQTENLRFWRENSKNPNSQLECHFGVKIQSILIFIFDKSFFGVKIQLLNFEPFLALLQKSLATKQSKKMNTLRFARSFPLQLSPCSENFFVVFYESSTPHTCFSLSPSFLSLL